MGVPKKLRTFKEIKNFHKQDEAAALQAVCKKNNVSSRNLKAQHTEKTFIWKEIR
ncbi:hypothetical protein SAMN05216480_12340 [Pustulibacterium marinum]|uniref:Uncharacterized protein n=1 Tax=Pustulibacterium marinum TaxID=1224947 RepID=A0A1I7IWN3_9FLAO|nr:hypothetical protein [Pustulibacterium marinum]SFU77302.1 hypothetical protein SAMN05216480_12340 [Pustulibacterium marinum]